MTEAALTAINAQMTSVMVLSMVSIGLNILVMGLLAAALIMAIIFLSKKIRRENRRMDD